MELILQDLVSQWNVRVFTSSDAVTKHSDQASLEKGFIPAQVQAYMAHHGKEVKAAGVDAAGLITCTSGDRVRCNVHQDAQLTFSFLYSPGLPAHS